MYKRQEYTQWGQTNVNLKDYKDYKRPDGSWRTWNINSVNNQSGRKENDFLLITASRRYKPFISASDVQQTPKGHVFVDRRLIDVYKRQGRKSLIKKR